MKLLKLLVIPALFFTNNVLALHEFGRDIDFHLKADNVEEAVSGSTIMNNLSFSHAHLHSSVLALGGYSYESSNITFNDLFIEVNFTNYPATNEISIFDKKTFRVNAPHDTLKAGQINNTNIDITFKMTNVDIIKGEEIYKEDGDEEGYVFYPTSIAFTLEAHVIEYIDFSAFSQVSPNTFTLKEEIINLNFSSVTSEVPVPAAAWLFGSSLLILASRKRRNQ